MMKIKLFLSLGLASILLWNCSNMSERKVVKTDDKLINQREGGTISLKLAEAGCYIDVTEPSNNTAEWNVNIKKTGRYKVWLSSATKDTINLNYSHSIKVNLPDSELVVIPKCDIILKDSQDVTFPYFRADSYIGSFYISDPGEYNIQVVSDKVISKSAGNKTSSPSDNSKLMAVILSPMTN